MMWRAGSHCLGIVAVCALLLTHHTVAGLQCFSCTSDSRECPSQASVDERTLTPVTCTSDRCVTVVGLLDPAGAWRGCSENSAVIGAPYRTGCYRRADRQLICVCDTDRCNRYPVGFVPQDQQKRPNVDYLRDPRVAHRDQRLTLLNMAARITRDPWWRKVVPEPVIHTATDFKMADFLQMTQQNNSHTPKPPTASTTGADFSGNLISEGKTETWISAAGEVEETVYDEKSEELSGIGPHVVRTRTTVQPTRTVGSTRKPFRTEEIEAVVPYNRKSAHSNAHRNVKSLVMDKRKLMEGQGINDRVIRQKNRAESNNHLLETVDKFLEQLQTLQIPEVNKTYSTENRPTSASRSRDTTPIRKSIIQPLETTASQPITTTIPPDSKSLLSTGNMVLTDDKASLLFDFLVQLLRSPSQGKVEPDSQWLLDKLKSQQKTDRHKEPEVRTRTGRQDLIKLIESERSRNNIRPGDNWRRPTQKFTPERDEEHIKGLRVRNGYLGPGREMTNYYRNDPSIGQGIISDTNYFGRGDYISRRNKDITNAESNVKDDGRYGVLNPQLTSRRGREKSYPTKGHRNRPRPRNHSSKTKIKGIQRPPVRKRTGVQNRAVLPRKTITNSNIDHRPVSKTDNPKRGHPEGRFGDLPQVKTNYGIIKASSGLHPKAKKKVAMETYDPPWMRRSTYILDKGLAGWQGRRRPHRRFHPSTASAVTVSKFTLVVFTVCIHYNVF